MNPTGVARKPAPAIAWRWSWALLGGLCSLPAALVTLQNPSLGLALAFGALPAAAVGVQGTRRSRHVILIVGVCIGLGLIVGAALAHYWFLAVGGVFVLCVGAAVLSAHNRIGALLMMLAVPMVGGGLSFNGDVAAAVEAAAVIVLGAVFGWLLCLCWPEAEAKPGPWLRCPDALRWSSTAFVSGLPGHSAPGSDSASTWTTRVGPPPPACW